MSLLASLLLGLLPALPAPLALEDGEHPQISLEQLLERSRLERDSLLAGFRQEIRAVVSKLEEALDGGRKTDLPKLRARLLRLGPEATPLLVLELDPGNEASAPEIKRAEQIVQVLIELSTRNVSLELLQMFQKGSSAGQRNALRVLAHSDDLQRVSPVLRERFADLDGNMRALLIAAIATLGGDDNFDFVGNVLANKDPKVVKSALQALTDYKCAAASPKILDLVRSHSDAATQIPGIVAYYRACPSIVDEQHCSELVSLTEALKSNSRMAERVLYLLSEHEADWGSKIKKRIKELTKSSSNRIAEAAKVCLARAGDRGIKKKLLAPYAAVIQKNDLIASSWQRRADVNMLIGEYKDAIRDYLEAQKLSESYQRSEPEIYIGIARCYARLRKPKDAAKWLDQGGLNISQLHLLSRDPDFAELLEDEGLKRVFRLDID